MNDNVLPPLRMFNSQVMLDNIKLIKTMIQRIRQKEGGIGSDEDELSLHRSLQDLDLLVDIVDGIKAHHDNLAGNYDTIVAQYESLVKQRDALKNTYESMVAERNEIIKDLRLKLANPQKKNKTKKSKKTR